ncbi:hypothetical protein JTE90_018449 [Oedothorax gibbosus]|uniref:Uncharacterized protein n=1 Tax=Oedothorax gibbosus TaxID=931172 RepID=A0AAV6UXK7_9ARAC|nr:hypothetical protein JTE90_018449 [Oedothorax gibbosus]
MSKTRSKRKHRINRRTRRTTREIPRVEVNPVHVYVYANNVDYYCDMYLADVRKGTEKYSTKHHGKSIPTRKYKAFSEKAENRHFRKVCEDARKIERMNEQ